MSRQFTVIGIWDRDDLPVPIAAVEHPELIHRTDSVWVRDVLTAPDPESALELARQDMNEMGIFGWIDDVCRNPECWEPLDDGEGYDGHCGNCADVIEASNQKESE